MAKHRLSKRQRDVLETIELNCRPVELKWGEGSRVIPVSMWKLGQSFMDCFWYESEFKRFMENLESRGFIRIEKRDFIYITDAGREAVTDHQQNAAQGGGEK